MTAELIGLLRPHVRFAVGGPVRPDWRKTAPAHVDVVGAMATDSFPMALARASWDHINESATDAIAGIDFGGALIAAALSGYSDGDFPARFLLPHRLSSAAPTPMDVIGDVAGKRVVVVDDVADVRDLMGAVSALREAGAIVEDAIVVVDREEGADALLAGVGVRLRALVTLKELVANA